MSNDLQVKRVTWPEGRETLRAIREQVFILEQGVPRGIEVDGGDEEAFHFIATLDGEPVACGRLQADGKVSRMAVLPVHRGRGFGRQVLDAIIAEAGTMGLQRLYLHAQAHAGGFYRKAGFVASGDIFDEADIPHVAMALDLQLPLEEPDQDFTQFVSGLAYPQPFDRAVVALCQQARREICIQSPDLDHAVFSTAELVAAVSALARDSRQSRVRILVSDPRPLLQQGHRLLELARRIPSVVQLRTLAEHPDWNGETVVIRDHDGVLFTPGGEAQQGFYEPDSRASTRKHLELFEELWRHGNSDANLRSLAI